MLLMAFVAKVASKLNWVSYAICCVYVSPSCKSKMINLILCLLECVITDLLSVSVCRGEGTLVRYLPLRHHPGIR